MRLLLDKIGTLWVLIALAVAVVAFVAGVNYGLRTSGGILAQEPSPTYIPPWILNTPTRAEVLSLVATAEAKGTLSDNQGEGLGFRVREPNKNKPTGATALSKEEAALIAAYDAAKSAYYETTSWPHVKSDRLTPNLQKYLTTNPDRAIYLVKIDRLVHLPEGVKIGDYYTKENSPPPILCSTPAEGCPTDLPWYYLRAGEKQVSVDGAGHVFIHNSDILPDTFSFLSEFKAWRYR